MCVLLTIYVEWSDKPLQSSSLTVLLELDSNINNHDQIPYKWFVIEVKQLNEGKWVMGV